MSFWDMFRTKSEPLILERLKAADAAVQRELEAMQRRKGLDEEAVTRYNAACENLQWLIGRAYITEFSVKKGDLYPHGRSTQ